MQVKKRGSYNELIAKTEKEKLLTLDAFEEHFPDMSPPVTNVRVNNKVDHNNDLYAVEPHDLKKTLAFKSLSDAGYDELVKILVRNYMQSR